MQIHQIKKIHRPKDKKRVGRGGKKGTYSGKGVKGQKSRAGRKMQPMMRELFKRFPKLSGYRQEIKVNPKKGVDVLVLEKKFETGTKITPLVLLERKIIHNIKGRIPVVKILGRGEVTKKFFIADCQSSKGAKAKIEKAGGSIR